MTKHATFFAAIALAGAVGLYVNHTTAQTTKPATQPAAGAKTFDFADPKGVNSITFFVDSKLEPFGGIGGGISGKVTYDPGNPEGIRGEIAIPTSELRVANGKMTEVMLGEGWLDAENAPTIRFTFEKVTSTKDLHDGGKELLIHGHLSVAGVKIKKYATVRVYHIEDGAKARGGAKEGDLLVLKSEFSVGRKDFNIKTGMDGSKVGNTVRINVGIAGYEK